MNYWLCLFLLHAVPPVSAVLARLFYSGRCEGKMSSVLLAATAAGVWGFQEPVLQAPNAFKRCGDLFSSAEISSSSLLG